MQPEGYRESVRRYLATPRGADASVHAVETLAALDPALVGVTECPTDDQFHIIRVLIEKLADDDQGDLASEEQ